MKIELLYFEGCPNVDATRQLIESTIAHLGIESEIELIHVHNDEEARNNKFLGSPSVRVNGIDIEFPDTSEAEYSMCCLFIRQGCFLRRIFFMR